MLYFYFYFARSIGTKTISPRGLIKYFESESEVWSGSLKFLSIYFLDRFFFFINTLFSTNVRAVLVISFDMRGFCFFLPLWVFLKTQLENDNVTNFLTLIGINVWIKSLVSVSQISLKLLWNSTWRLFNLIILSWIFNVIENDVCKGFSLIQIHSQFSLNNVFVCNLDMNNNIIVLRCEVFFSHFFQNMVRKITFFCLFFCFCFSGTELFKFYFLCSFSGIPQIWICTLFHCFNKNISFEWINNIVAGVDSQWTKSRTVSRPVCG